MKLADVGNLLRPNFRMNFEFSLTSGRGIKKNQCSAIVSMSKFVPHFEL